MLNLNCHGLALIGVMLTSGLHQHVQKVFSVGTTPQVGAVAVWVGGAHMDMWL